MGNRSLNRLNEISIACHEDLAGETTEVLTKALCRRSPFNRVWLSSEKGDVPPTPVADGASCGPGKHGDMELIYPSEVPFPALVADEPKHPTLHAQWVGTGCQRPSNGAAPRPKAHQILQLFLTTAPLSSSDHLEKKPRAGLNQMLPTHTLHITLRFVILAV